MSGGYFEYKQDYLTELAEELLPEERIYEFGKYNLKRLSKLLLELEQIIHDIDWHLCSDEEIENPEMWLRDKLNNLKI